jgi:hypothetical protein
MIVLDGVDPSTNADAIKEAIYSATWLAAMTNGCLPLWNDMRSSVRPLSTAMT